MWTRKKAHLFADEIAVEVARAERLVHLVHLIFVRGRFLSSIYHRNELVNGRLCIVKI